MVSLLVLHVLAVLCLCLFGCLICLFDWLMYVLRIVVMLVCELVAFEFCGFVILLFGVFLVCWFRWLVLTGNWVVW